MYAAILLALAIRYNDLSFLPGPQSKLYLVYFTFIHIGWVCYLYLLDFYTVFPVKGLSESSSELLIFLGLAFATSSLFFYFEPIITPKTILIMDVLIFGLLITGWRSIFNLTLRLLKVKEKIIIIGPFSHELNELHAAVLKKSRYSIINYDIPKIMNTPDIKERIWGQNPDMIVLPSSLYKENHILKELFLKLPLGLNYVRFRNFYENLMHKVILNSLDEIWFLENLKKRGRIHGFFKRAFDIFFSVVGLLATAALFPVIAILIKIMSPGPVIYKQKRVGQDNRVFTIYKFRTMSYNPEENNPEKAQANNTRIFPLGNFLRLFHLDELPQFYNVLKGDLSFVGPRPEWIEFAEVYSRQIPFYETRHLIKPGLTGWAQIKHHNGAKVEDVKEKLKYDLYYIKHHSIPFDLAIILRTLSSMIKADLKKLSDKLNPPVLDLQPSIPGTDSPATATHSAEKINPDILVLDDEQVIQDLLKRYLNKFGYNVFCASKGNDALGIVKNNNVKVAIVDLRLPGFMNGLHTLKHIKKMNNDIEVILITGYGNEKTKRIGRRLGAYAYLEKPLNLLDIKKNVEESLRAQEINYG